MVGKFVYESYIYVYISANHCIPRDTTCTAGFQYRRRSCRFRVLCGVAGLSGSLCLGSKLSNSSNPTQLYLPSKGTSSGVQQAPSVLYISRWEIRWNSEGQLAGSLALLSGICFREESLGNWACSCCHKKSTPFVGGWEGSRGLFWLGCKIGLPRLVECNRGTKNSIPITGTV